MTQIIDFSKSSIGSFSQSLSIPVLAAPSSNVLTQFGLATMQGGNVLLNASIGVQAVTGSPLLLFSIFRGGSPIFTIGTQVSLAGDFEAVGFSYVDSNAGTGYFAYTMTVSQNNSAATNSAILAGPVEFSGLSMV